MPPRTPTVPRAAPFPPSSPWCGVPRFQEPPPTGSARPIIRIGPSPRARIEWKEDLTTATERLYPEETADAGVDNSEDEKGYVSSLNEKGENEGTAYGYGGYGGAGEYVQVPSTSWMAKFGQAGSAAAFTGNGNAAMTPHESSQTKDGGGRSSTRRIGAWLASQYIFRQAVYVSAVCILLWIPGLVAVLAYGASSSNRYDRPSLLSVGLFWWSVWLSISWIAIWVCYMIATVIPTVLRHSLGVLSVALKRYISYAEATRSYITFLLWTLVAWIIFLVAVWSQFPGHDDVNSSQVDPLAASNTTNTTATVSTSSASSLLPRGASSDSSDRSPISAAELQSDAAWLVSLSRLLFGLVICSAILLAEKVLIQSIALSFHQTTYADRVKKSEYHIDILTALLSSTTGTFLSVNTATNLLLEPSNREQTDPHPSSASIIERAHRFKLAEALKLKKGRVTTFPDPRAILDLPESPFTLRALVESSLENEAMCRKLSRQIFSTFAQPSKDSSSSEAILREGDISKCFKTSAEAHEAFAALDRDNNGSCTRGEFQASVLDMHKERVCLLASLHDVDSAVLKLDNFFMSFYLLVSCVIIAALMSLKFSTLLVSLGTILLGLSWLVGNSAQESLTSIVWVFGKHPVDVGDAVQIPGLLTSSSSSSNEVNCEDVFVVEEIQLLSSVLRTRTGKLVLVSNFHLAQRPVINYRRSGPTVELFTITVEYATTFEQIEKFRELMVNWLKTQGREFQPGLDIELNPQSDLTMISLTMGIRYKSNWQDDPTRARRRNTWMTALKTFMDQQKIYGPAGRHRGEDDAAKLTGKEKKETPSQYVFMDSRDSYEDTALSTSTVLKDTQQHSRLNEAMPFAPRQHSMPTTQMAGFNVRGRRGGDEHVGDLERGSP